MTLAKSANRLRFRRDLICQGLQMGTQTIYALKDPLSRDTQYVDEDEHSILELVDGKRSVAELLAECSRRFASHFVSADSLIRFLAEAKRRGLLVETTNNSFAVNRDKTALQHDWWKQLFAIRLPGIRPDHVLNLVFPVVRHLITPLASVVYGLVVLAAFVIAVVNWETIASNVAAAFAQRSTHTLLQFIIVVSAVKVVHELAHAAACKACGGDCRELGVMLLLGVPCLYCDVSDAWLMPQRYKRILVSAAGMIVEIGIAAVATLLWLWTSDALLREWWLVVMVVCSVSTVIVNGNPLMRYDGYFILSDLIAIPNLAARSSSAWQQVIRRIVWSEPFSSMDENQDRQRIGLAAYAVVSGIYRTFVLTTFAVMIYRITAGNSLAIFGILFGLLLAIGSAVPAILAILTPPSRLFGPSSSRPSPLAAGVLMAVVLGGLLVPLPRTVVAPMTIRAAQAQDIYAAVGGRLLSAASAGSNLGVGDMIATLDNAELRSELLTAQSAYARLETEHKNLSARRSTAADVSAQLEATSAAMSAAADQIALLQAELKKLCLVAPQVGIVYRPYGKASGTAIEDVETWSGTPLDAENIGTWIEPGTVLCGIGDPLQREAVLMVEQRQAGLVKCGQFVRLLLAGGDADSRVGEVIEVGAVPVIDGPVELSPASTNDPSGSTKNTFYQVRVRVDQSQPAIPIRTTGIARIEVDSTSLARRLLRSFRQSFR